VLVSAFVFSACSLYSPTPDTSNTPVPTVESSVTSNTVNIQNFTFNPATLTVKKGTTVTWTNNDSVAHQLKSAAFNSTGLTNDQTFSFTFTTAGTFDYACAIHPSMTGKIIVE
jgi:plastocyanin